jgi:hypothetical protein
MLADLETLEPEFKHLAYVVLIRCMARGHLLVPYFAIRSPEEQARLWRQSRTRGQVLAKIEQMRSQGMSWLAQVLSAVGPQEGPRVTGAPPGLSWHQWGEGLDCYADADGVPGGPADWDDGNPAYRVLAEEAAALGLKCGLFFTTPDPGHLQLRPGEVLDYHSAAEIDAVMRARYGS